MNWKPVITLLCCAPFAASAENLLDLYQLAVQADPQFSIADQERKAALSQQRVARSSLLPSVTAGGNVTKEWGQGSSMDNTSSGYLVSLTQSLFNRDSQLSYQQAGTSVEIAETDYLAAQQDLILRVSTRYFDVLAAQDNLTYAMRNKEAIGRQLNQAQQRFDVGLIAITDVRESEALHDLAQAEEIQARNQLDIALESLREVIGQEVKDLAKLSREMPLKRPDPEDSAKWVEIALENNPQYQTLKLNYELSGIQIERSRAARLPTLNVVGKHQYGDVENDLASAYSHTNSVGLELSVPLYLGGSIKARTEEAVIRRDQNKDRLEQNRRAIQRQARQAYLTVIAGISQANALKQAVVSTQTAYEATNTGFEVGTRTSVDVLNIQRDLLKSQRDYDQARYNYVVSTLQLKQAAGLVSEKDVETINKWLK